jgi:DEAD/DEAH box helicase domain-containing protein
MASLINYKLLADRITRDAARATAARLYFSNRGVRQWLNRILTDAPGEDHSFLADPLFEATFSWQGSGKQWGDLNGNLLSESTLNALDYKKSDHPIKKEWSVFTHQLTALETLLQSEPKSLVVSSGTGSGKTECFLVPILETLAREVAQQNRPIEGVRALFLYPLNALINSQQERLSAWMSPFNGNIRYCLYNGETKHSAKEDSPERVLSRKRLRESPPPVLLTNATMLEYMLVRSEDNPILEKSAGKLEWIVLDEAHTYIGSQAAELALLLRRVMIGFGVEPQNVRFVATSATIGDNDAQSKKQLQEFIADLAGISAEQVVVAIGKREIPELENASIAESAPPDPAALAALNPEALYDALIKSSLAMLVREQLTEKPRSTGDLQIATAEKYGKITPQEWLSLIHQFSRAVSADGDAFLPTRLHLYHRTFEGLWACINPNCSGKPEEIAADKQWSWGAVSTHAVETCPHCQSLALELVRCSECGNEHLLCEEHFDSHSGEVKLLPRRAPEPDDEFGMDLVADQWEAAGLDTAEEDDQELSTDNSDAVVHNDPRYLPAKYTSGAAVQLLNIDNKGAQTTDGTERVVLLPDDSGFRCAMCNSGVTARRSEKMLFRSARAGMPFYSLLAGRNLLRTSPAPHELENKVKEPLPFDGRKILTFSDSRQGTARLAMSQQQDADRSFVRSQIYHQLAQASSRKDSEAVAKLEKNIYALKAVAEPSDGIRDMLDAETAKLELLQSATPALTWTELRDLIANNAELTTGSRQYLNRTSTISDISNSEYANFCLYREFIRRPKKGSTLETLGLAAIRYPAIENLKSVPPEVAQKNIDLAEWKTLLTLSVNFVFRAGYAVDMPRDWERWIGERARTNVVRGPSQERVKGRVGWPTAKYTRSTLIKLLHKALDLALDEESDKQWLDSFFRCAWNAIAGASPSIIRNTGEGFQLGLADAAEVYTPTKVWQCPFTGRAFDRVFRNVSPYIPWELSVADYPCIKVNMPQLPQPFWTPVSGEPVDAEDWLERDESIEQARDLLLWENHSDLVARYSRWYGTGEHSAQQDSYTLQSLTSAFNSGRVNILNCSTTMEMGVDIAGISAVMMNNAPPGPANYLQRAGRAGRRGETTSTALTICSTSAHGSMLFSNPHWPFTTPTSVPRVSLESADITQRHVNALLLSIFLKPIANALSADCGWFYEADGKSTSWCEQFIAWLDSSQEILEIAGSALGRVVQRTVLASQPVELVITHTRHSITDVESKWLGLISALEQDLSLQSENGDASTPAAKAIEFRLKRLRKEYLLHELATQGFLPGYGFPTDVVSFVTTTINDLKKDNSRQQREDNRTRSKGYPSRDLPVALREYAPGADIALNGRVYTSAGVLLNWHIPPGDSPSHEVQALKTYWSCRKCGAGGTTVQTKPNQCPACGYDRVDCKPFLEPAGFAVELTYQPHNDTGAMQFMPVTTPRLHVNDTDWSTLADKKAGRVRYSDQGIILYRNSGRHDHGYAICLRCGRAAEHTVEDELPAAFTKAGGHKRLRGGKDKSGESICEASHEDHSIVRNHQLAHQSKTSIAELQLNDPVSGKPLSDKATAWSLAVAMRYGLVQLLGIEESEVGIAIQESSSAGDKLTQSIFLYDTTSGGAGYTAHLPQHLPAIMKSASSLLDCHCETRCHSCLLSYDTQHQAENLNRNLALEFLQRGVLNLLELPKNMRYFGPSSKSELYPLPQSLSVELGKVDTTQIDIVLAGEPLEWRLAEWDFLQGLIRYGINGGTVKLLIPDNSVTDLPGDQQRFLNALSYSKGIELCKLKVSVDLANEGTLLAVSYRNGTGTGWAVEKTTAPIPGPNWGAGDSSLVSGSVDGGLIASVIDPLPQGFFKESTTDARLGAARLTISDELNVPIDQFGHKLWALIFEAAPELKTILAQHGPATSFSYSDKYIKSPLCMRLLGELVVAAPAEIIDANTSLKIITVELETRSGQERSPAFFHDNWQLDNQRRMVTPQLLDQLGWAGGEVDVLERRNAPHYRELAISWPGGKQWSMQLDQGFGTWKYAGSQRFPFDQNISRQASDAARINPKLIARYEQFNTYFFIDGAIVGY